jgi:hypothetical protein
MNTNIDANTLLAEATERLKAEAYAAGWRDALAAVAKAVSSVSPPEAGTTIVLPKPPPPPASSSTSTPTLTPGSTPAMIYSVLSAHQGLTAGQIIEALGEQGHSAPENSIRTNIHRLKDRQIIVLRHGKWFVK